jgi:hypothetical protein
LRTKYNKLNNNSHLNNLSKIRHQNNHNFSTNNVNGPYYTSSANKLLSAKNHSVDNLLDVDSNYGCYYQVHTDMCSWSAAKDCKIIQFKWPLWK